MSIFFLFCLFMTCHDSCFGRMMIISVSFCSFIQRYFLNLYLKEYIYLKTYGKI